LSGFFEAKNLLFGECSVQGTKFFAGKSEINESTGKVRGSCDDELNVRFFYNPSESKRYSPILNRIYITKGGASNVLVANRNNGERLSLGDRWDKKELIEIRSKEKFHCPVCKEEVILKLGSKKIWHFSHLAGGMCEYEYDRESEYHLSGKLQLYSWLKKQGIHVELEKFDPQIRQKPDITFQLKGQKYALEFQCSAIPEPLFVKRTKVYLENGYIPIWIAAANLIKRTRRNVVSVSNFLYLFLRRPHHTWNIPAFCPISRQFINLHGVFPISSQKTLTYLEVQPIHQISLNQLLSPAEKQFPIIKAWQAENQRLKSQYVLYPGARQNPFLQELYHNRLSLLTLPSEIGLPVFSSPYIETPSFIWQTFLYLDVFRHYKKGDLVKYARVLDSFNKRMKRGEIKLRNLPLAGQRDYLYPLAEYILLLTKVSFLSRINSGTVKVNREIIFPSTIEEQIKAEEEFLRKHQSKITEALFK
jgi:competence protein CoiA